MRVHFCLFGVWVVAAQTLANVISGVSDSTVKPRYYDSLQHLTDNMNRIGAELEFFNHEFNNWNGHNRRHQKQIEESHYKVIKWAQLAVQAWNDVNLTPSMLTHEEQAGLPTALLFQNMVRYADIMRTSPQKWTKWRDSGKKSPTARAWLDASKPALDEFLHTVVSKMEKDLWNNFRKDFLEGYENAFKLGRDAYP